MVIRQSESGLSERSDESVARSSGSAAGISVRDLNHYFLLDKPGDPRAIEALHNVNLEVTDHEFVALVGPSGCGKTTLLNMVAGLIKPHSGSITVGGAEPKSGRPDIAYMFARDALLPWRTALHNVMFGMEIRGIGDSRQREEIARDTLRRVGLESFADAYRTELSQGMRQRVALARTFALPSDVLLMDEPFGALDPQLKIQLGQVLLELWEQNRQTVLFVTHDLHEAIALADRVVVMNPRPGHIAADIKIDLPRPRSVRELQTDPNFHDLYTQIWEILAND